MRIGSRRIRLPVAAKIALVTAGATGGTAGSPTPPHFSPPESARWVRISGISFMRSMRYESKLSSTTAPFLMLTSP